MTNYFYIALYDNQRFRIEETNNIKKTGSYLQNLNIYHSEKLNIGYNTYIFALQSLFNALKPKYGVLLYKKRCDAERALAWVNSILILNEIKK